MLELLPEDVVAVMTRQAVAERALAARVGADQVREQRLALIMRTTAFYR